MTDAIYINQMFFELPSFMYLSAMRGYAAAELTPLKGSEMNKLENGLWAELPKIKDRGWAVLDGGRVRDREGYCPVCALVEVLSEGSVNYRTRAYKAIREYAGENTDAVLHDVSDIVYAADFRHADDRPRLLDLLGLST